MNILKNIFKPYIIRDNNIIYGIVWKYPFSCKAMYVDIKFDDCYLSDSSFYKYKLSAKFIGQLSKDDEVCEITMCKCKKKDFQALIKVIYDIHNSALIKGYGDEYEKCGKQLDDLFKNHII